MWVRIKLRLKIKRVPRLGSESAESYDQYTVLRGTEGSIDYPEEVSGPVCGQEQK